MLVHDIQSSFGGGEVAPDLHGRVDLAKYKTSAKTMRNFIPGPHGSVYNRPGTYFVASTKNGGTARLVPFVPTSTDAYVLEFGNLYIRFYKNGGQILAGMIAYEVATPYNAGEIPYLCFTRSADTLYIAHSSHAPMTLKRTSDANWTLAAYPFDNGPFMLGNADTTKHLSWSTDGHGNFITTDFDFFQALHVGGMMQATQNVDSQLLTGTLSSTGVFTYTVTYPAGYVGIGSIIGRLTCGGGWRFRTHGTWTGTVAVQKSYDGSTWTNIQTFVSKADVNFDTFGTEDIALNNGNPFFIRANMISYTSGTCQIDLSADSFETFTTLHMIEWSNARKMYVRASDPQFNSTSLWAEGSWSSFRGFPGAVNFFQDRLAWANTPTEPETVWFTKTSNYVDFGRSIPLADSDGITISLQSREVSPIVNITASLNTCLFFTATSYWTVSSDSGGSITPTSVFAKVQETRGSNNVVPVAIGNRLIFISSLGTTVRDIQYQYLQDQYQSENISISSDHLFKGNTVADMAYAESPDSIIWLVSNGILLSCTYLREQEVLSWARHDTQGNYEAVCTIPGNGYTEVWFVVHRNSNRMIERMLMRTLSTDPADQYFVDCGLSYSGAPVSSLSGFAHLNGLYVSILANGTYQAPQIVSGGAVTVPAGTTKASVGLSYESDLEPLNPEIPMQNGTSQGRKYQINRCVFRFLNTVGGFAGPDFDTLDAIPFDGNAPVPLFTGFVAVPLPPGSETQGRVVYRQVAPLPVTILSMLPIVDQGQDV